MKCEVCRNVYGSDVHADLVASIQGYGTPARNRTLCYRHYSEKRELAERDGRTCRVVRSLVVR